MIETIKPLLARKLGLHVPPVLTVGHSPPEAYDKQQGIWLQNLIYCILK
ncbi:hypothetical protein SLEP1_g5965 [Rubroshorea leprosula]|uniref:Uncharacterized protein n=1 Tax=Rubroshorea leprosula TaxID=152421 RepID=A0AAV5HZH3_9ROSI|nr:hypothetical protein SLEP1_g5965 [Rubroshorea leprosula]